MSKFAKSLKTLRQKKNLTQEDLSIHNNISHSTVSHYEQGLKEPAAWRIACLEAILGVPLGTLYRLAYDDVFERVKEKKQMKGNTKQ